MGGTSFEFFLVGGGLEDIEAALLAGGGDEEVEEGQKDSNRSHEIIIFTENSVLLRPF